MAKKVEPADVCHEIACGIDVHKSFLIAVICIETEHGHPIFMKKRFSLFTKGLRMLRDWLIENNCFYVCMESTGKYWIPVFNILEKDMEEVRIVNPKWVKQVRGEKDDEKDARMICNKYRHGETKKSYIPDVNIRDARMLTRLRTKLTQQLTSTVNRITNMLLASNYRLDMIFSSVKTKSAQGIINLLVSDKPWTEKDIMKCVHKRCKASEDEIRMAVDGIPFTTAQKEAMKVLLKDKARLEDEIAELSGDIARLLKQYQKELNLLTSIPGIGEKAAENIIAEVGVDMGFFVSPSKLTRWAGLAQDRNQSADRKYSNRIGQGGKYLKPLMVQCAWAVVRSKNRYYKMKFDNISGRRGQKRAIIAIARKLLVSVWAVLTYGKKWAPLDMNEKGCPRDMSIQKSKKKLKQTISEMLGLGMSVEEISVNFVKSISA